MTREEMLSRVHDLGCDASADYDDGVNGWFGWRIEGPLSHCPELVVTFDRYVNDERVRTTERFAIIKSEDDD